MNGRLNACHCPGSKVATMCIARRAPDVLRIQSRSDQEMPIFSSQTLFASVLHTFNIYPVLNENGEKFDPFSSVVTGMVSYVSILNYRAYYS